TLLNIEMNNGAATAQTKRKAMTRGSTAFLQSPITKNATTINTKAMGNKIPCVVMYRCVPLTAPTAGTHAAPTTDAAPGHALPRNVAVQGLEVSLRHLLQNLLLQRQIRHQPPQASVFLLQLLHPACLFQLQTAVFLAPAIVGLFGDALFPARLPGGLVVGYFDFDLPQDRDDLFRTVFLPRHAPAPLVPVSLTFPLVQNSPVRSDASELCRRHNDGIVGNTLSRMKCRVNGSLW